MKTRVAAAACPAAGSGQHTLLRAFEFTRKLRPRTGPRIERRTRPMHNLSPQNVLGTYLFRDLTAWDCLRVKSRMSPTNVRRLGGVQLLRFNSALPHSPTTDPKLSL